ncbi:MAG: class I SAM-dependent methyltransferase [Cuniculiplasma sp.]
MNDTDFGTYHHTTREESENTRTFLKEVFHDQIVSLMKNDWEISVLDAGCGMGFLSYVAAISLPNSRITGVDIFDNESLLGSSKNQADKNIRELGLTQRVSIEKDDLRKLRFEDGSFELVLSNLVFHNLGKERFSAYSEIFRVMKEGGYFILGDLFMHEQIDSEFLRKMFKPIKTIRFKDKMPEPYAIKIFLKV